MPSDDRIQLALDALRGQREAFRSALAATVAEVQGFSAAHGGGNGGSVERVVAELGPFGAARIDTRRFASLFADSAGLDTQTIETVRGALTTLQEISGRQDDLFVVDVASGTMLRDAVAGALEEIGRVFGASRVVEQSRSGRHRTTEHARSLGAFPYGRWSRAERRVAPPIVVHVDGRDLHAPGLAEFLDGGQKIILVVRGESAPAPLVRLITPVTFVLQTADATGLDRLAAWDGPGVAALVPPSAARFVHDPAAGGALWERLTVLEQPPAEPQGALGGLSRAQQVAELEQLRALAAKPAAAPPREAQPAAGVAEPEPTVSDPAGKLAAWLLSQADIPEPE